MPLPSEGYSDEITEATMSTVPTTQVVMRRAASSKAIWAMGSLFEHLAESAETEGAFGLSIVTQPPGVATPLHRHTREAEAFYVLDGTITYRAGDELFDLTEGDFIYLPQGVPHAFRIRGDRPARVLALSVPGNIMGLYDEVGRPAPEHRLPGRDGDPGRGRDPPLERDRAALRARGRRAADRRVAPAQRLGGRRRELRHGVPVAIGRTSRRPGAAGPEPVPVSPPSASAARARSSSPPGRGGARTGRWARRGGRSPPRRAPRSSRGCRRDRRPRG